MKSVTEFSKFVLVRGIEAKAALATEGKTPEEIQASLGETFKYEGEKLQYFINSLDVAEKNTDISRVVILRLSEDESSPSRGVKIDDLYYVPEGYVTYQPQQPAKDAKGGRGGRGGGRPGGFGGGNRNSGPKESPWGLSPEQKAAKKGAPKGTGGGAPKAAKA